MKFSNYLPNSFLRKGAKPKRLVPRSRRDEGSGVVVAPWIWKLTVYGSIILVPQFVGEPQLKSVSFRW